MLSLSIDGWVSRSELVVVVVVGFELGTWYFGGDCTSFDEVLGCCPGVDAGTVLAVE